VTERIVWRDKKVSVVLPTYNEKDSIYDCIQDFLAQGVVDELIVVNNNAAPGTSEEVARAGAIEVFEKQQGYGYSMRRGLMKATGDYIVVAEPDGTFVGRDIFKLLAYSDDFEIVYGTRTAPELIWQGANMGWFLKWGNWGAAKLIEFLFNSPNLTDVGCTFRLLHRPALEKIQPYFTVGGNYFSPEMMVLSLLHSIPVTQIPVNYRKRVGQSMATGSLSKTIFIGLRMIGLILGYRLHSLISHDSRYGERGDCSLRRADG
jgi:glycosyltransferase involved in cell wall biosynthesis